MAVLGLIAGLRPIQQWNWCHFPGSFAVGQVVDGVAGSLLMGILLSLIVKPRGATEAQ